MGVKGQGQRGRGAMGGRGVHREIERAGVKETHGGQVERDTQGD